MSYINTSSPDQNHYAFVGGIVGNKQEADLTLKSNCNLGNIFCQSGYCCTGGILGHSLNYSESLYNCYNGGNISQTTSSASNASYTGGLVGYGHSTMGNCVSTGIVSGTNNVGILVGGNFSSSNNTINNCYGLKTSEFNASFPLFAHNEASANANAFFDKEQHLSSIIKLDSISFRSLKPALNAWVSVNDSTCLSWMDLYNENIHAILPLLAHYVCAQPAITVSNGQLTITSPTKQSTSYYTLDGTKPIESTTTLKYEGPVTLSSSCIIRAVATATSFSNSSVVSYNNGLSVCEKPVISIDSCTVSISCATPGAVIAYTLDGNDPRDTSLLYNEPFTLFNTTTIKAYAYIEGGYESDTIIAVFRHPLLWDGSIAKSFAGGSGSEADPYLIATAAQLKRLSYYTYYYENWTSGKFFKLVDDIVLNSYALGSATFGGTYTLNTWEPIGNGDGSGLYDFKGIFDGNGHTIHGLFHELSTAYYLGLFGATNGAIIKNVHVDDSYLHGYTYIGGLVGKGISTAILNSSYIGTIKADNNYTGGLAGYGNAITIDKSQSSGKINGLNYTGGIIGYVCATDTLNSSINYCTSNALINGSDDYTGGVSGYTTKSTILECSNTGNVYGADQYVGGISGYSSTSTIRSCTNDAAISTSHNYVAGIVGFNDDNSPISYCTNNGNVTNFYSGDCGAGGIASTTRSNLSYCINAGKIIANSFTGGIIGKTIDNYFGFSINNCRNYGTIISNYHTAGGIIGDAGYIYLTINNSYNFGSISAIGDRVGGIVGHSNVITININNCFNKGIIMGNDYIGGLVGQLDCYYSQMDIKNSFNEGFISGKNQIGGILGGVLSSYNLIHSILSCYNSGTINAAGINAGGLCGHIEKVNIYNSYNTANVTSSTRNNIGGLIGSMVAASQLFNAYNTGSVSGSTEDGITNGALVGYIENGSSVKYCHSLRNDSINLNLELYGVNEGTTAYLRGFDYDQQFEIGIQYKDSTYGNLLSVLNAWSNDNAYPNWIVTSDNKGFPIIANFKCATPTIAESDFYYSIVTSTNGATIYYTTDGSDPLKYGKVYEKPFTASSDGLIKAVAVCVGYFDSELASYDCSLTGILLGDANDDKSVRPSDVVTTVNYILGNNPSPFLFRAADVNNNGEITASDIVNIVRIILGTYPANLAPKRMLMASATNQLALSLSSAEMSTDGLAQLDLSMENSKNYSAIQFDITLPEGVSVSNVKLDNSRFRNSHVAAWNQINSTTVRVLAYSANNSDIINSTGSLLSLSLKADEKAQAGNYILAMNNIYLIDALGNEDKIESVNGSLIIGSTTGFSNSKNELKIISGKVLKIVSPSETDVTIYTTDGCKVRDVRLSTGLNILSDLPQGVYLINKHKAIVK
ncbi:MAG: chitobiase/beta-hexosaminidase C-terminal domain-containing protein [Bacteroidota bacterium]|nr:chitobiase/beta-hexosaminidase C-terminal domain-containing protein [Bacteroidota bacterium]